MLHSPHQSCEAVCVMLACLFITSSQDKGSVFCVSHSGKNKGRLAVLSH
eukprot:XP_001704625.1 Hypothetical protein GL50803_115777 [Giardia lamblia ATCC 50803]